MEIRVFISSVQAEFADERQKLVDYIRSDALLGKFFVPFLFEELPAMGVSAQRAYLHEAATCDIYLGIFGFRYGNEDNEGISPTEREYDTATAGQKHRLIFITRPAPRKKRHPKQSALITKAEQSVVRKSFSTYDELQSAVYNSLVRYLEEQDYIRRLPFDASYCQKASLDDLSPEKIENFVHLAQIHRGFPLSPSAGAERILTHLNLITSSGKISNTAILLFGKRPQDFFPSTVVKCAQFYGTEICKPIPSHHVFTGTIFEVVDKAVDFVMSRIDMHVGTRAHSNIAPVTSELPREAVSEAIVNAVVHRDYSSNGSVQVMLFRDRLEIWNPGKLPYSLNIDALKRTHPSIPANPTLAHTAYLAGYIEEMGTGTSDIIGKCEDTGLNTPQFIQDEQFRVVIWREQKSNYDGLMAEEASIEELLEWNKQTKQIKQKQSLFANKDKTNKASVTNKQQAVIRFCSEPRSSQEIMEHIGVSRQTRTINLYIGDLIKAGQLRPTIPDKPNSPQQRYVATYRY